jgi:hypothetical protein
MNKFVSILVSLLFTCSVTAVAFAVDKEVGTSQKIEKGSQMTGEKKDQSPAITKNEVKEKETKKAHKAKKIKKGKKHKKHIKKASKKPSPEKAE